MPLTAPQGGPPPPVLPMATIPRPMRNAHGEMGWRLLANETAIAFSVDSATLAVMMATPEALEDFALGFCLTEGLVPDASGLLGVEVVPRPQGIELRLELSSTCREGAWRRQRRMLGPVGCGLCGVQSLEAAMRALSPVKARVRIPPEDIMAAVQALGAAQHLHHMTHSLHAAGFWQPGRGLLAVREDVGRHNALDKLAGALLRARVDPGAGAIVLTSRLSVELVQKAAMLGCPAMLAVSAPTDRAVEAAAACGMTLVCCARDGDHMVFPAPDA